MKILLSIFVSAVVFINISAQTTTSAASPEAAKLSTEVVKLFQQQKYDEALPLAQKVIEIREKESGKNHLSVAQARRNLAYIQQRRGKLKDAQQAFENALDIYEKNQPLSTADEKVFMELLGLVATYQANDGGFDKAEQKLRRAVELSEKISGKDALETSEYLLKLAQIYQLKLEYAKAAPLFLRALDIKAGKLGKTSDETRFIFSNATCALRKNGQEEQVKQLRKTYYPPKPDGDSQTGKIPKIINGGIINGKALELAKPAYPAEARAKRASGAVSVEVTIDEAGKVIFACASSGAKELQRASEVAAYNSKFAPATLSGQPVKVTGVVVYNYVP